MKWSPQQDAALIAFKRWHDSGAPGQIFHLFGFAGTGKTTLAMELASGVEGMTCFAAFTGKAASVMRNKGCYDASTIHALIYKSKSNSKLNLVKLERELSEATEEADKARLIEAIRMERKTVAQPAFTLNEYSKVRDAKLIVVDEVSMVDGRIGEDLMSFGVPILVLGDPAQLPPVKGAGFFMTEEPEVMLTEVHRTALDNPVLQLATLVRQDEPLQLGDYGESRVVTARQLESGAANEWDQVIVGKNATRRSANTRMRTRLGREDIFPVIGDKVICLKNNHELGLLNGTLFYVEKAEDTGSEVLMSIKADDNNTPLDVEVYRQPFLGEEIPRWSHEGLEEFDFGYAITCHKSQGSEWKAVFIVDESQVFRNSRRQWLYTAITRASEKVMVVR